MIFGSPVQPINQTVDMHNLGCMMFLVLLDYWRNGFPHASYCFSPDVSFQVGLSGCTYDCTVHRFSPAAALHTFFFLFSRCAVCVGFLLCILCRHLLTHTGPPPSKLRTFDGRCMPSPTTRANSLWSICVLDFLFKGLEIPWF